MKWSFLTFRTRVDLIFVGRQKSRHFSRVAGTGFTSRLGKTKFLELGFWSKLIVVQQNALSQRLPMAAVGFLFEKIEGAWGSQFGCRAQERFLWIFFVHPSDKNQEPTSHLQTLPFVKSTWAAQKHQKSTVHHRMIKPITFTPSICHKMFQNHVMMNHETAVIYIPGNFRSWMLTMKLQSCSWEFPFLDVLGVRGFFVSNFISSPSLPITISIPFMQRSWTKKTTYF